MCCERGLNGSAYTAMHKTVDFHTHKVDSESNTYAYYADV